MLGPTADRQTRRILSTVNECVTNNGHWRENSTCLPGICRRIQQNSTQNTALNALGAGNRQFESGHPENGLFVQ